MVQLVADSGSTASRYGAVDIGHPDLPGKDGRRVVIGGRRPDAEMQGVGPEGNEVGVFLALIDDRQADANPRLAVVPVLLGGGLRLLPDGVSTAWNLASATTLPDGALGVHYRRR